LSVNIIYEKIKKIFEAQDYLPPERIYCLPLAGCWALVTVHCFNPIRLLRLFKAELQFSEALFLTVTFGDS
jgi:hypothetical protein